MELEHKAVLFNGKTAQPAAEPVATRSAPSTLPLSRADHIEKRDRLVAELANVRNNLGIVNGMPTTADFTQSRKRLVQKKLEEAIAMRQRELQVCEEHLRKGGGIPKRPVVTAPKSQTPAAKGAKHIDPEIANGIVARFELEMLRMDNQMKLRELELKR